MWTPAPDKALHFGAGAIATAAGYAARALASLYVNAAPSALLHGLAFVAAAALAREAYNVARGGQWSWADIGATLLGAVPVVLAAEVGR